MSGPNPSGLCFCGCGERTNFAKTTYEPFGWVKGEPHRFIRGHQRRKTPIAYVVDEATGCWIWQRATDGHGYGHMTVHGRSQKAYRHYYELAHRAIPPGFDVHHLCRNRLCVNADHMELVRHDEHAGGRGHGKLTRADARRIRALAGTGQYLQREIAVAFGVSRTTVCNIANGKVWRAA